MTANSFSRKLVLFAAAVFAAAVAVLNIGPVNAAVKNAVFWAVNPAQKNLWAAGAQAGAFFQSFAKAKTLAAENDDLRRRLADFAAKGAAVEELKKENEFLRQALSLGLKNDFDLELAEIVAKFPARDVLVIDKGENQGIKTGMPVITEQKALAGKISKTYADFSEVTLATGKGFSFDVKVDGGAEGLIKGQGGYCAALDLVPKDKEICGGQAIFTSQSGGIFPAGFLVGTIKEVAKNDVETFQSASISPAFDALKAARVFVARGKYPLGFQDGQTAAAENQ